MTVRTNGSELQEISLSEKVASTNRFLSAISIPLEVNL